VRFVSTPEVLEFVSSVEDELTQIEEAISMRAMESASPSPWGVMSFALHPSSELFYTQVTTSIMQSINLCS
jgi:hypothetical protein